MSWTTTLNRIRAHEPCAESWEALLYALGKTKADDTEVSIEVILDLLGFDDALWALRAVSGHDRELRLLAVSYARDVQHLMTDPRSHAALGVAERYAYGDATDDELAAAWRAAWAAAWGAAWEAARAAAREAARDVAWAAAREAAWAAAWDSARDAAQDVAWAAAWGAAWEAARQKQLDRFRAMVRGEWPAEDADIKRKTLARQEAEGDAIKAGETVEGVEIEQGYHVRIR
jgi:hypothetical protein